MRGILPFSIIGMQSASLNGAKCYSAQTLLVPIIRQLFVMGKDPSGATNTKAYVDLFACMNCWSDDQHMVFLSDDVFYDYRLREFLSFIR